MRVWRGPQGAAAAAVLGVMVVWRAVLLSGSYFNQDDFYLSGRAYDAELGLDFLFRDTAGHVNPLQQLTYWLVANHAPYDWAVVGTFVLALQVLTTVVMWHVLSRVLPGRWVRVPLLAAFAWAPITLATTLWWSAAMGLWPHLLCSLLAVLFLLRLRAGAGPAWLNGAVVVSASVVGLLWHERAVLIAPVVLATAVVMTDAPVGWRRPFAALRRHWVLWTVHGVLLVGYLLAHARLTDVEGGSVSARESAAIGWSFVGENVLPGVLGGPWTARLEGGAVHPPTWGTVVAIAVGLGLVALLLWRGGPARRWAVALFAAYVLADLVLVLAGRGGFGRLIGLDPRYSADVIQVAVLSAALGLRGSPPAFGFARLARGWRRWRTVGVAGLTAAYLVGCVFGTAALVPHFQNEDDRAYVTAIRERLAADPRQTLVDDLVPAEVVLPLVGEDSLLSRVLAPLPEAPVFGQPTYHLRSVAEDGHLVATEIDDGIGSLPGRDEECGYRVTDEPVDVRFPVGLKGELLLQVGYFTNEESVVEVTAGSWRTEFLARPGPNDVWVPVPDLGTAFDRVGFSLPGSATVCVPKVLAGRAVRP